MSYTNADIISIVKEYNIHFMRLQFTDIAGSVKSLAIPTQRLNEALNGEITLTETNCNGFDYQGELALLPDRDSLAILPWRPGKQRVARMVCDLYDTVTKQPYVGCVRSCLKRTIASAKGLGYTLNAGAEVEFFLFNIDKDGKPTTNTADKAGYFDLAPMDVGEEARRTMVHNLELLGFEVESAHHEVAEGQHEIRFRYVEALDLADKLMTFKAVIKNIARNHGLHATFMPKPVTGIDGSGLHLHLSIFNKDINVFWKENNKLELSEDALFFTGGLIKHTSAWTAITNSTVNSYKRFVYGYDAPVYVAWSIKDRGAYIRVPQKKMLSTRIEIRSPDATCNPYLALASLFGAGLDGIKNKIKPPEPLSKPLCILTKTEREFHQVKKLPENLAQSIKELEENETIKRVLGRHITENYISNKKLEWQKYSEMVHNWEREYYMSRY